MADPAGITADADVIVITIAITIVTTTAIMSAKKLIVVQKKEEKHTGPVSEMVVTIHAAVGATMTINAIKINGAEACIQFRPLLFYEPTVLHFYVPASE